MRRRRVLLAAGAGSGRAEEQKTPRIRVEPEAFDFGKALPAKTLRKEFTLSNFGDAALVIENVSTTCGCTAALASDTKLAPGSSTVLRVTLETRSYSGKLERQVWCANDPEDGLDGEGQRDRRGARREVAAQARAGLSSLAAATGAAVVISPAGTSSNAPGVATSLAATAAWSA